MWCFVNYWALAKALVWTKVRVKSEAKAEEQQTVDSRQKHQPTGSRWHTHPDAYRGDKRLERDTISLETRLA
jgi:hypothetical protein